MCKEYLETDHRKVDLNVGICKKRSNHKEHQDLEDKRGFPDYSKNG